ncbi:hypothetical protein IAT38_006964 [Cryptococcus sp. DSM 104549]
MNNVLFALPKIFYTSLALNVAMTALFSKLERQQESSDDETTNASDNEEEPAAFAETPVAEQSTHTVAQPPATGKKRITTVEPHAAPSPAQKPNLTANGFLPDAKWGTPPAAVADGDWITLISSDKTEFCVPKCPTFRQIIMDRCEPVNPFKLQSGSRIQFEDTDCETADILRHVLDMIDGSWSPSPTMDHDLRIQMVNFTRRWECQAADRLLINSIEAYYQSDVADNHWLEPFRLALHYGEIEVAGAAFKHCHKTWIVNADGVESICPSHWQSGFPLLHPNGWSLATLQKFQQIHIWALLRVFQSYGPGKCPSQSEADGLKKMFLELVKIGALNTNA